MDMILEFKSDTTAFDMDKAVQERHLPFEDFAFKTALAEHYFFVDSEEQDTQFHLDMIKELTRVATEVNITPLVDKSGNLSMLLGPVLLGLQQAGFGVEIKQGEGSPMLRVWAKTCQR